MGYGAPEGYCFRAKRPGVMLTAPPVRRESRGSCRGRPRWSRFLRFVVAIFTLIIFAMSDPWPAEHTNTVSTRRLSRLNCWLRRSAVCVSPTITSCAGEPMRSSSGRRRSVTGVEANAELTRLKRSGEFPWLKEVSCIPLQQCLRHQQAAFKNFFEGRAKYPVLKSKKHRQSAEFTRSAFSYRDGKLYMAKSRTPLDIPWSSPLPGEPSTLTISRTPQAATSYPACANSSRRPCPSRRRWSAWTWA